MATVPHVTAWVGRTKYQADGFLFDGVYKCLVFDKYQWEMSLFQNHILAVVHFNSSVILVTFPLWYEVIVNETP